MSSILQSLAVHFQMATVIQSQISQTIAMQKRVMQLRQEAMLQRITVSAACDDVSYQQPLLLTAGNQLECHSR
ncbi:hypothetical protein BIW11_07769 [Tropilaelaps mercedesae]|uniref:Uncharacterized protein n=1 Tax=Tropilaelaps mercedesae TaxID=418985 RepID=A0A1V9XST3_9ACAR|nr:hypothetical protein BIW11_07769 [Tropilaelaps mercedesae]